MALVQSQTSCVERSECGNRTCEAAPSDWRWNAPSANGSSTSSARGRRRDREDRKNRAHRDGTSYAVATEINKLFSFSANHALRSLTNTDLAQEVEAPSTIGTLKRFVFPMNVDVLHNGGSFWRLKNHNKNQSIYRKSQTKIQQFGNSEYPCSHREDTSKVLEVNREL